MGTDSPKFPLKCRKCGREFLDSLGIAIHLGFKSDLRPLISPCRLGATERDVTQVT